MIRRLHALAPAILTSGAALLVSLTAVAQAVKVDYVTVGEMHRFVVTSFLGGAGTILGGLAIVYAMVDKAKTGEMRTLIQANADQVAANAKQIAELLDLFGKHHLDPDAHPAGSRARIDPINLKLDVLTEKLTTLAAQYEAIQGQESGICAALADLRRRDPKDSPHPRRAGDSGDDYTPLRGPKP